MGIDLSHIGLFSVLQQLGGQRPGQVMPTMQAMPNKMPGMGMPMGVVCIQHKHKVIAA